MEMQEFADLLNQHTMNLNAIQKWSERTDQRLVELEKTRDLLSDIKIALAEFKMSNKYFLEKMEELKNSIDSINKDNREQHEAISKRVKEMEDGPGKKWEKFIWLVFGTIAGGILTFLVANFLSAAK